MKKIIEYRVFIIVLWVTMLATLACIVLIDHPHFLTTGMVIVIVVLAAMAAALDSVLKKLDTKWMPIATAPDNKKLIVGYFNTLGNWRSVMACYYTEGTLESDEDTSGFAPEGWYESTESYEYLMPCEQAPTHWMHLCAAPFWCS